MEVISIRVFLYVQVFTGELSLFVFNFLIIFLEFNERRLKHLHESSLQIISVIGNFYSFIANCYEKEILIISKLHRMIDLKNYDNAVIKFRKSLNFTMLPVLSWDFYASNYEDIKRTEEDAALLLNLVSTNSWNIDTNILDEKLKANKNVVVVTDAKLNIVFATKNMWNMSQYHPEEVIGKSPKMFQGNLTSKSTLKIVSDAVNQKKPFEVTVVNYRKDGSTYNCWIQGEPIFDKNGAFVNFIAFEKEVA